jgi:hypothetical protein
MAIKGERATLLDNGCEFRQRSLGEFNWSLGLQAFGNPLWQTTLLYGIVNGYVWFDIQDRRPVNQVQAGKMEAGDGARSLGTGQLA